MTVLIVGSGVIGLRTAVELIRRKTRVRIVSKQHPLHSSTCSVGAGGLWMPFHCDDERTDKWAFDTLDELCSFVTAGMVEIVPAVSFKRTAEIEGAAAHILHQATVPHWAKDPRSTILNFQTLTIDDLYEASRSQNFRLPKRALMDEAGYKHSWLFYPPIVDSPKMLMHLVHELEASKYIEDINFDEKEYCSIQDMVEKAKELGCDSLINCTGLGARALCSDASLVGARGVLLQFDRASCHWDIQPDADDSVIMIEDPPFGSETAPSYMIPRGNIIAVGGTYLEGDEESGIRPEEMATILQNARRMGIDVDKSKPPGQWVGFRPYRPTARLEIDKEYSKQGVRVVHQYGFGGSGWTVFVGAAKEAVSLLDSN